MLPPRAAAAILLAAIAPITPADPLPGEYVVPLRIVTLNVLEGIGAPGSSAYLATGDFLTTLDLDGPGPATGLNPDIVALQECRSDANLTAFRDQFLPGYTYHRVTQVDPGGNFQAMFVHPDITVLDNDQVYINGPRMMQRTTVQVPNTSKLLTLYNVHFKAFGDPSSQTQRRQNADLAGRWVALDVDNGLDLDDNNQPETPAGWSVLLGDLNSNNNSDQTLNGVWVRFDTLVRTPLVDWTGAAPWRGVPVESIGGAAVGGSPFIATFPSSNSRLDYIVPDEELAAVFDTNGDGVLSQAEVNAMGFVYFSGDDGGAQSSGDQFSTSFASDHRPVVFDLRLQSIDNPCPGDANNSLTVDFSDLNVLLSSFGDSGPFDLPADFNYDRVVNFSDLNFLLAAFGDVCAP